MVPCGRTEGQTTDNFANAPKNEMLGAGVMQNDMQITHLRALDIDHRRRDIKGVLGNR